MSPDASKSSFIIEKSKIREGEEREERKKERERERERRKRKGFVLVATAES